MYEFDINDIKIVNLLLEDGRMSASEMSRRMGDISERSIRYRIDRMIDDGVIQISAVVSPEAEIYHFVTETVRKVTGVRKTTTSIVPIILKDVYQWRVPERIAKELAESKATSST